MKILFLDESGDHNLTNIDESYPLFVLAGIIVDQEYHQSTLQQQINKLKERHFKNSNLIIHYRDYTRNQNGFEMMSKKDFREGFYKDINELIAHNEYILLACIIDKKLHKEKYGLLAIDPYTLSLQILVERFVMYLKQNNDKGIIIAESRGNQLDNELNLSYLNLKINGTKYLRPIEITENIENVLIKKKNENIAGLQLVDTLATPIGRRYLNLKNYYLDYEIIKSKFRRVECGKYIGYGLVVLPKK